MDEQIATAGPIPEPPAEMFVGTDTGGEPPFPLDIAEHASVPGGMRPLAATPTVSRGHYAVVQAREQHGVGEPEAYARYVRYFGVGGAPPWCVYFAGWCFDTSPAGNHDRVPPWGGYGSIGHTATVHAWASAQGFLVGKPQHGDIYGRADMGHTGLVVGANPEGTQIYTINGNWSDRVEYATWTKQGGLWVCGASRSGLWFARY